MGLKYTKAVDFWSLGVLVYEMLLGQSPFQDDDEDVLYTNICTLKPYFPSSVKPEASSFVLQVCLFDLFIRHFQINYLIIRFKMLRIFMQPNSHQIAIVCMK